MTLSAPPVAPVAWTFRKRGNPVPVTVVSRTWFDARRQAMAILGAGLEEIGFLDVEMVEREADRG